MAVCYNQLKELVPGMAEIESIQKLQILERTVAYIRHIQLHSRDIKLENDSQMESCGVVESSQTVLVSNATSTLGLSSPPLELSESPSSKMHILNLVS